MAKELWGLNSWFNEGEQSGYIVVLKNELEGRKRGKGTSAAKNIGREAHEADMAFYEDEARSQAEQGGLKGKEIDFLSVFCCDHVLGLYSKNSLVLFKCVIEFLHLKIGKTKAQICLNIIFLGTDYLLVYLYRIKPICAYCSINCGIFELLKF